MKKIKYLLVVLLLLSLTACFNDDENNNENQIKIAIIGDSVSAGCNPELSTGAEMYANKYGWVHMLAGESYEGIEDVPKTIYDIHKDAKLVNYAITGSKAYEWNEDKSNNTYWKVWDKEFQKVLDFNPDIAVIYLGANDMFEYVADGKITEGEWAALKFDISGIVSKLKAKNENIKIIIPGYYDLFDGYSQALAGMPQYAIYTNLSELIVTANNIFKNVADENDNTEYVSVYEDFFDHCYGRFVGSPNGKNPMYVTSSIVSFDIHPVTAGHKKIYEIMYEKFKNVKVE